ncbi:MAG: hypothetical protein Q9M36_05610 [Sulfurovum sp.]|nr:hypothetical protein [Sulfurovum sp.]
MAKTHPLGQKIIAEYGSIKHFAKVIDVNLNTLKVIIYGKGKSAPITAKLVELGLVPKADDKATA